jgi:hypothetical protein
MALCESGLFAVGGISSIESRHCGVGYGSFKSRGRWLTPDQRCMPLGEDGGRLVHELEGMLAWERIRAVVSTLSMTFEARVSKEIEIRRMLSLCLGLQLFL